jgi:formate dehydrogenase iron-sulfur subunit
MIAHVNSFRSVSQSVSEDLMDQGNLIDLYLSEQKQLTTAVTRFSHWHDKDNHNPRIKKAYQDLIPLSRPEAGEQYAFQVDLDTCSGCKACVAACHNLNGLDHEELWREVGLLHVREQGYSHQQTVTTACHHCADPACSNGCPVLAYDKDEVTGIVRHLDDQCIGCQYCVLKCPYDVPKYNKNLGIVRKCDMCHSRLSAGEAPACVQSCPNEAIRIIKINESDILTASTGQLVPGAFPSNYTRPSTRYLTKIRDQGSLQPADATSLRVEHTHTPLVIMLVLTQAAAGAVLTHGIEYVHSGTSHMGLSLSATLLASSGLLASILHLGRPLQAWRAFLGWRKSWLSREILAFGAWFPWIALSFFLTLIPKISMTLDAPLPEDLYRVLQLIESPVLGVTALLGILSVICSIMVYVDTRRPFWSLGLTIVKFMGTVGILGSALAAGLTGNSTWIMTTYLLTVLKVASEAYFLWKHLPSDQHLPQTRSARVMWHSLKPWTLARFATSLTGCLLLRVEPVSGITLLFCGEVFERILFFRAVTAPRMPGTLS